MLKVALKPRAKAVVGCVLGGLAILILWLAVWRHPPGFGRDLFPSPDAAEYVAGAVRLAESSGYSIEIAGERLPSRYPPGFSVLLLPWLFAGVEPSHAPLMANGLLAFVLLGLVFSVLWCRGWRLAAGLATLLIATTPAFLVMARSPLSDLCGTVLATAALVALVCYGTGGRLVWGSCGTLLLGLSVGVRMGNVLFALLVAAAVLLHGPRNPLRVLGHGSVLLVAGLLGAAPLLFYNDAEFGSPFASGYALWLPDRASFLATFQLENLLPNVRYLLHELTQTEWRRTCASEYGHGSYLGSASPLLLVVALLHIPRGRIRWMAVAIAAYGVGMLFYFFQDGRFFLPLLPVCAVFVAVRLEESWPAAKTWWKLVSVTLLGLHLFGVPGSHSSADIPRYLFEKPPANAPRHQLLQRLKREPPGLVLSTFSPPHARAVLGSQWIVAHANNDHGYRYNPKFFRYADDERRAQIEQMLGANRPVYLLAHDRFEDLRTELWLPRDTSWRVLHGEGRVGIARLKLR